MDPMLGVEGALDARWLVLVGGGTDSAVLLGLLRQAGAEFAALHFDYGQKTRERERAAATDLARRYEASLVESTIPLLGHLEGHGMLEGGAALDTAEPRRAYVPFRNTLLLAHAAAWAEHHGYDRIALGSHASDRVCPDNSKAFVQAFQALIDVARLSPGAIRVEAPLVAMTKAEVVALGHRLEVPFELTWSCYNDPLRACGTCGNCRDRLEAFAGAGLTDPLPYR